MLKSPGLSAVAGDMPGAGEAASRSAALRSGSRGRKAGCSQLLSQVLHGHLRRVQEETVGEGWYSGKAPRGGCAELF